MAFLEGWPVVRVASQKGFHCNDNCCIAFINFKNPLKCGDYTQTGPLVIDTIMLSSYKLELFISYTKESFVPDKGINYVYIH